MRSKFVLSFLASLALAALAPAQVPQLVNYQGRVTVGGTNVNAMAQFKFSLVNGAGNVTYWSNDGTGAGGNAPTAPVSLNVQNGLYSVLLGDATLPGMTAVPSTVFNNADVRLRIWFNDGASGFQLLSPDQRIAAVGYAMMAGNVPDGAITSAKLAAGAVSADKLATGAVNSVTLADTISLGQTNVAGRLDIYRTAANTPALSLVGSSSSLSTYGSDGLEQVRLHGTTWGEMLLFDKTNNTRTVRLSAGDEVGRGLLGVPAGGSLLLSAEDGEDLVFLNAGGSGGTLTLYQNDGNTGLFLDGDSGGAGLMSIRSTNGSTRIQLDGYSTTAIGGGEISVYDLDGTETIEMLGGESTSQGSKLTMRSDTGVASVVIRAEEFGGTGEGPVIELFNSDGQETVEIDGDSPGGGVFTIRSTTTGAAAASMQAVSDGSGFLTLRDAAGNVSITLDGDLSGQGRITTQVIQITGGSDLSENFDIKPLHQELKAGMIVCIDPEQPGQLVTSTKAYDKTVAGIMSGAGGVRPGMLMGQQGSVADGKHPVALTGRVYCWVDADQGAIKPGDMITTSEVPGHGMKVQDQGRAQGAIIGKAMSSLETGKGLVLVLVSLQ